MQHIDALQRVRALLRRDPNSNTQATLEADGSLSGPNLIDQEPDLAKEASRHSLATSGWAAGGQPTD